MICVKLGCIAISIRNFTKIQARSFKNTRETSNMYLVHVILQYAIPNDQVRFYTNSQTILDKYNI